MPWLMFLPFIVVDGKPQRQMLLPLLYTYMYIIYVYCINVHTKA